MDGRDGDGIPVCSEMWPGNTTDVTTLDQVAGRLQSRFGVRRVCLVADAGMMVFFDTTSLFFTGNGRRR